MRHALAQNDSHAVGLNSNEVIVAFHRKWVVRLHAPIVTARANKNPAESLRRGCGSQPLDIRVRLFWNYRDTSQHFKRHKLRSGERQGSGLSKPTLN